MTLQSCTRHPHARPHRGHCPACLLEHAIAPGATGDARPAARFTLEVPLGRSMQSSVFLVSGEWPWQRLLRLKQWTQPAATGFVSRFADLQSRLKDFDHPFIVRPVAAWLEPQVTPSGLNGLNLLESQARA